MGKTGILVKIPRETADAILEVDSASGGDDGGEAALFLFRQLKHTLAQAELSPGAKFYKWKVRPEYQIWKGRKLIGATTDSSTANQLLKMLQAKNPQLGYRLEVKNP